MIYPTTTVADPESSGMKMPRQATFLHYGSIDQTAIIRELKDDQRHPIGPTYLRFMTPDFLGGRIAGLWHGTTSKLPGLWEYQGDILTWNEISELSLSTSHSARYMQARRQTPQTQEMGFDQILTVLFPGMNKEELLEKNPGLDRISRASYGHQNDGIYPICFQGQWGRTDERGLTLKLIHPNEAADYEIIGLKNKHKGKRPEEVVTLFQDD